MAEILANWEDFTGGHWGNLGPSKAPENAWGGVNMTLAPDGSLIPVCSSRWLQQSGTTVGRVWGMYWAWGADGRLYYIQQAGTQTSVSRVYRFSPDVENLPNATVTSTVFAFVPTTEPDWVSNRTSIYFTVYGQASYEIITGTNTVEKISGTYGQSPGGRCIAIYKDRIFVGGVSDARFGDHPNRIHFSGDDTGNNPANGAQWEDLNYFDVGSVENHGGTPTLTVTGLYPMRDYMVVVTDDQQVFILSGTPPTPPDGSLSIRRAYGFHEGSGGATAFLPSHGAVDPSQSRTWLFDHTSRVPMRFNGANMTRVTMFGAPYKNRLGTTVVQGAICMIGGPDEFVVHGVAVGRGAGEGTIGHRMELVRYHGVYTLVTNDIIAARQ